MIEFVKAFLMWFVVFSPSAFVASLTARSKPRAGVLAMQTTMLMLSLLLIALINPGLLKIQPNIKTAILASLSGFGLSFPLSLIQRNSSPSMPGFLPGGVEKLLILLFLAPLSEETLNRALIGGYLLSYGHLWSAILFSALLFALPHWMAFEGKKSEKTSIVVGAFLLGSLAGMVAEKLKFRDRHVSRTQ